MNRPFSTTREGRRRFLARGKLLASAWAACAIATSARSARGHDARQGDLHIGHPWAPPAAAGGIAEIYFAIVNRGERADRLVGADTPVAPQAILAETTEDRVVRRDAIDLVPARPVPLRPGRLHVRLDGLKRTLGAGDTFPLTLHFAASAPVAVTVLVEAAAGH